MTRRSRRFHAPAALWLLAAALPLLCAAPARAGKRDYVDHELGFQITLPMKGGWTQTPTQPGERIEVAKFKDDRQGDFDTLSVYRFPKAGDEATTTPGEGGEGPDPAAPPVERFPYPGREIPKDAKSYLDTMVGRMAKWMGQPWEGLPEPDTKKFGKIDGQIYEIEMEHAERKGYRIGLLAGIVANDKAEYLLLFTRQNKLRTVLSMWVRALRSFRFPDDDTPPEDEAAEEQLIEKRDRTGKVEGELLDTEKRDRIKAALEGTWRFIDTPHYIVIYNCDDRLAQYIAKRVEYMREFAYEKVFPPVEPIEECMVVRVCKEMDEYYHYGAPRGSAGYFSSGTDELVFPDLSRGSKPDEETIGVMHHEAFHQYIHYALLKNNLPIWFNEGFAEYFFCVEGDRPKLQFMKRHPMRYGVVKSALGTGELIPLKDFTRMNQPQYYSRANLCYAEGWAFATWLMNVTKNERYHDIPRILFQEMQKGYLNLRQERGPAAAAGMWGEYNAVVEAALKKAFDGIDMDKLDEDFRHDLKKKM